MGKGGIEETTCRFPPLSWETAPPGGPYFCLQSDGTVCSPATSQAPC